MTDQAWKRSVGPGRGSRSDGPVAQRAAVPGKQTLTEGMAVPVQRKAGADQGDAQPSPASPASSGGGRPLPEQVRRKMEGAFASDFSAVRIHEGSHAGSLGAFAFTQGNDIHFAPGQYDPDSRSGQELLGHELAHVVQQREGRAPATTQAKGVPLNDNPALEAEADALGARAAGADGPAAQGKAKADDACPTCGGDSQGGSCATCQGAAGSGVVQRQPAPGPAASGAACHATNRAAGPQHEAIQAQYIGMVDPTGVREYAIPGGSSSGAVGFADLASLGTGAIYEIKPYIPTEIAAGLTQVAAYVAAARVACNRAIPWHPGVMYPDSVIPLGDGELVAKQYGHPGLILYYTRRRQRERVRQPTYERVLQVLLALGLSLGLVVVVIAALADPEPATKLALAGLSVVMVGLVLEAFGLKEADAPPQA